MCFCDLARHEQPDGPVLLRLDAPHIPLGLGHFLLKPAVLLGIEGVDTRYDEAGILEYPTHLAPYRLLQSLRANVVTRPAFQAETVHSVAPVVPAGGGQVVAVLLAAPNVGGAPRGLGVEAVTALAAPEQVLQQVSLLRVPPGLSAPLLLQGLRPLPGLVVDDLGDRHLNPGVLRLLVDLDALFGGDDAFLAVNPRSRVGLVPQNVVDVGLTPEHLPGLGGNSIVGQPHGDGGGAHPLVNVHVENAPHHLGLLFDHHRPAVVSDAIAVGELAGGHPSLLGRAALAQGGALPEVVQLDLADGGHESEGLHVDGVHDGLQPDLVGLDHLHEGGSGVHSPAEAVRLPADDDVEASLLGVGQDSLELGTLLGPAPAYLLVAGSDGETLFLAVGFHLADLLGDGGLVLPVLALVGHAGVDGRPVAVLLSLWLLCCLSCHNCLLKFTPHKPKRPAPAGNGSASSTIPPHHLSSAGGATARGVVSTAGPTCRADDTRRAGRRQKGCWSPLCLLPFSLLSCLTVHSLPRIHSWGSGFPPVWPRRRWRT